ncbi:MAG: hypothetical protein ACRDUY_09445 [Nitriliruptorales bacterium]
MPKIDRFINRARRHLGPNEGLVATVVGREAGGRRRTAIVATDARILLVTLRPEPPVEVSYRDLEIDVSAPGGSAEIVLRGPDGSHGVDRIGDATGARLFATLVRQRLAARERPVTPPRVEIVAL